MPTVGDLNVKATLDTSGFKSGAASIKSSLSELSMAFMGINQGLELMQKAARAVLEPMKALADMGLRVQALHNSFVTITGDTKKAADELEFLAQVSEQLGLDMYEVADSYKGVAAAAKGTVMEGQAVRDMFYAMAEAGTALHMNGQQMSYSLLALQQMMSKGKVSSEELRRQLGEHLPGAMQIAARAMGVTSEEFEVLLEKGMSSFDFLPKFIAQLHKEMESGAKAASHSVQAELNRLVTAWDNTKKNMAAEGFMDGLADGFKEVANVLKDPAFQSAVKDLGNLVGLMLKLAAGGIDVAARVWATAGMVDNGRVTMSDWLTMSKERAEWLIANQGKLAERQDYAADLKGRISRLMPFGSDHDKREGLEAELRKVEAQIDALVRSGAAAVGDRASYNSKGTYPFGQGLQGVLDTMGSTQKFDLKKVEEFRKQLAVELADIDAEVAAAGKDGLDKELATTERKWAKATAKIKEELGGIPQELQAQIDQARAKDVEATKARYAGDVGLRLRDETQQLKAARAELLLEAAGVGKAGLEEELKKIEGKYAAKAMELKNRLKLSALPPELQGQLDDNKAAEADLARLKHGEKLKQTLQELRLEGDGLTKDMAKLGLSDYQQQALDIEQKYQESLARILKDQKEVTAEQQAQLDLNKANALALAQQRAAQSQKDENRRLPEEVALLQVRDEYQKQALALQYEYEERQRRAAGNPELEAEVRKWKELKEAILEAQKQQDLHYTSQGFTYGFQRGVEDLEKSMMSMAEVGKSVATSMAGSMSDALQEGFFDLIDGRAKTTEQYLTGMLRSIAKAMASLYAQQAGKYLMAGLFHTGGEVGAGGRIGKAVDPALFAFAPRFHTGLMPDEFPAILQKGEAVIPKGAALGHAAAVPPVKVNINNQSGQAMNATVDQPSFDMGELVINVWLDAYNRNAGGLRTALGG